MDLLNGDVKKIYLKYFFTALSTALITTIYSSVDTIVVGHGVGSEGTAAISCMNPLWSIMFSLGLLIGIGTSIHFAKNRAQKKEDESRGYFTLGLILCLAASIITIVVFLTVRDKILTFFGADSEILPLAMSYSFYLAIGAPFFIFGTYISTLIKNDGDPILPTISMVAGGVINSICDVAFVYGLHMGMAGAGLATFLGQLIACLTMCSYFFMKKSKLKLIKIHRPLRKMWFIFLGGITAAVLDFAFGFMVILYNRQIKKYADNDELSVFGVLSTCYAFFQSIFYGVGQAIQPLCSSNYGVKQYDRIKKTMRMGIFTVLIIGTVFFLLYEIFPSQLVKIFMSASPHQEQRAIEAFRRQGPVFLLMGVNILMAYYLESIIHNKEAFVISLLRGIICPIIFIFTLPLSGNFNLIYYALPLGEAVALIPSIIFLISSNKSFEKAKKESSLQQ